MEPLYKGQIGDESFVPYTVEPLYKGPPNTTHTTQPLDVSFFGPLKRHWASVCHSPGAVVTKLSFSGPFSRAWYKATKPENIISGFRKGAHPNYIEKK